MLESTPGQSIDPILCNDCHPLVRSSDLTPGTILRSRLLGTDLVLWRGQNTEAIAWEDRCPHCSVRLSTGTIQDNTLI